MTIKFNTLQKKKKQMKEQRLKAQEKRKKPRKVSGVGIHLTFNRRPPGPPTAAERKKREKKTIGDPRKKK